MQTSGHGYDAFMVWVPLGVLLAVGIILFGGPAETLDAVNALVGDFARGTIKVIHALFS